MRRFLQRLAPMAVVLLLASCGDDAVDTDGSTDVAVPAETLVMIDNAFQPQAWEIVEPGTFSVENQGQGLHNLTIEAAGVDVDVQPGDSQDVEIDLDPGEYEMVCEYHIPQGMTGTVVVAEA